MDWLCLQSDLDNKTWSEIQQRLMEVQQELQMCIHKNELSHLGMILFLIYQTERLATYLKHGIAWDVLSVFF